MLDGAGLEKCLAKLEANWGNPHLDRAEAEEQASLLRKQELYGALFSAFSDHKKIKDALSGSKGDLEQLLASLAAEAAQGA